jgi:tetratricopeptide (TPR) repeat protein
VRVADVHPGPALELFISGTQWIDAFPGRLAAHVGRLANLLGEEEGRAPESEGPAAPRNVPRWALQLGAAAAMLLVLGAGVAFWPGPQTPQAPERADPLLTNPVWFPQEQEQKRQEQLAALEEQRRMAAAKAQEEAAAALAALGTGNGDLLGGGRTGAQQVAAGDTEGTEMIVGGNPVSPLAAGDPDYRACEKSSGDSAIAACDRAIASGKFERQSLSYLYNDRGFLLMQKGAIEAALADLNKAIETYRSNFYAYWNRGAIYAAKRDLARAQEDLAMALALNPDEHSSAKIREALNAVSASAAETAQPQASDPSVITDPSQFGGQDDTNAASALQSGEFFDTAPGGIAADLMPASPSFETPPMPAAPAPMPAR